ncbi:MAG: HsdM family class I SAM-dependent methyltransferase [Pyrinomonadaceae bacterium]
MSLKKYISEIDSLGAVSETALYTTLANHILSKVLHYPTKYYAITKRGAKGTPDIRLYSGEDNSEWIVCEAKLADDDIRKEPNRRRIWKDQILQRGYVRAETFYVLLCAPRTFYICDLNGEILEGVHIEDNELLEIKSGARLPATDANLRHLLHSVTFEASHERPQYERFRRGELPGGYIPLTPETIENLQETFNFALRSLRRYCSDQFELLKQEYRDAAAQLAELERRLEGAGSDEKPRKKILARIYRLKRRHALVLQLFGVDYPQFKHDQTYAGTEKEEHFEDIFITNTAYVALSRLFFVRICEDAGLTTRKISHQGPGIWQRFVEHIKKRYQDLIEVAFKDVAHIYSQLFETTVFDWYGRGNGVLHDILERILFRLNAFSFKDVNRDLLGSIYQYFRPKTERKRLGEYYTAEEVVDYILQQTGIANDGEIMQKRILDPACGSFTFGVRSLLPLLRAGGHLSPQNRIQLVRECLIGYDINPFSVFLSHLSLLFAVLDIYLEAKRADKAYVIPGFNIHNRNSLTFVAEIDELHDDSDDVDETIEEVADYVIGNPPFVRNERLPPDDRTVLSDIFSNIKSKNTDLSTYFLYSAAKYWLKQGGVLGMVAPIGIANSGMAEALRTELRKYSIFHIVSLEWMAKEIFPDADIIPMLVFVRKQAPVTGQKLTIVTGLRHKSELRQAINDEEFFKQHASQLDYQTWLNLSPTGDWPLEVTALDIPVLEKLKARPALGTVAKALFAIKQGAEAKTLRLAGETEHKETEIAFLRGQHVCAFSLARSDEVIDLSKIEQVSDASIWRDLSFYRDNHGRVDESGLGRYDYQPEGLVNHHPSDTLCCFVPEIYVTLLAAAGDPLQVCANNSVLVVVPLKYSAHVISAIINSRVARYHSFLLTRSAILLRRRSTWFPRALKNLPLPDLNDKQAKRLHKLSVEANALSQGVQLDEIDAYLSMTATDIGMTKAGFLGVKASGETIDRDELAKSEITDGELHVGDTVVTGEAEALQLLRLALLARDADETPASAIQNMLLPAEQSDRARIAKEIGGLAAKLERTKQRMNDLCEEMDDIVAEALALTAKEHDLIRTRCKEFPLSVTVESPRYVWSPDRKRQARRIYEPGERFK